jgi:hypothetical protein
MLHACEFLAYILKHLAEPLAKHGEGINGIFIGYSGFSQGKFLYIWTFWTHQIWFYMLKFGILHPKREVENEVLLSY